MNISEGQKLIKNKDYKKALNFFLNIKKKEVKNTNIFFYLGLIYFELNKFNKSIFYYSEFLKRNPQSETGLLNLALTKQAIGELASARKLYMKIININKNNIRAYYGLYMVNENFLNHMQCQHD